MIFLSFRGDFQVSAANFQECTVNHDTSGMTQLQWSHADIIFDVSFWSASPRLAGMEGMAQNCLKKLDDSKWH